MGLVGQDGLQAWPTSGGQGWRRRAGWLLRSHRLAHPHWSTVSAARFAQRFAAGEVEGVHPSTVSRWETGATQVSRAVVRRYEVLLGLRPWQLVTAMETMARYQGGPGSDALAPRTPSRPPGASQRAYRVDTLADRALDGALMTAGDWDELTWLVTRPGVVVTPGRIRREIAERLLGETNIADGALWMRRFEALNRLIRHPHWSSDVIDICTATGSERDNPGVMGAVTTLDRSRGHAASSWVLREITAPTSEQTFQAAVMICARKLRRRHFSPEQTDELRRSVAGLVGDDTARAAAPETLSVITALLWPAPGGHPHLRRVLDEDEAFHHVLLHGALLAPASAQIVVSRVIGRLPAEPGAPADDAVLRGLVDEVLHHPLFDVRLYAALMLRASPYAHQLTAALGAELHLASAVGSPAHAVPVLNALRAMRAPEQRDTVARLSVSDAVPAAVSGAAAYALGHIGGRSGQDFWRSAVRRAGRKAPVQAEHDLQRIAYALAMTGEKDLLADLASRPEAPARLPGLAGWWFGLPVHLTHSAAR